MPARSNNNSPKKSRPQHSKAIKASSQNSELIKVEEELLQKIRLYWQLGDWAALEALSEFDIKTYDIRAECALYIAAACFQLGFVEKAKTYQALALQWGASKQEVGRVMVSGVYNTLGMASTLANGETSVSALQQFALSAQIALPGLAVTSLIKARTQNQLERLYNHAGFPDLASLQLIPNTKASITRQLAASDAINKQLQQNYIFDATLNIWRRNTQHEFAYTDGSSIEQRILATVRACQDVSIFSRELLQYQTDWASEYHFSADRVNLLRPFTNQFKDAQVLELGCGCGAITRFLGESGALVTAVEGSQQRASIASERCRDLNNVTIVLDKLQDAPFYQQFDVVTLIGVLEYSRIYVNADDPIQFVLEKARSYLKPNGILIVAIENQLGLKYFAGAPEDHGVGIMAGINDVYGSDTPVTFGKQELERRFTKAGFAKCDTYLPFPDYKLPCLIVHPSGYDHHEDFDLGNILAGTVFYDRQGVMNPLFSMENCWPLISRNGLVADLANSHLFLVHNTEANWNTSENILASYYSPKRSAETSQEITFCKENNTISLRRRRLNNAEIEQTTTEAFINGTLHSQLLNRIVQRPNWTFADIEIWLQQWLDALEQSLITDIQIPQGWPTYDKWLPANYIDALPRNLIISDKGFTQFIDLEWTLPHALPLALVLYRGLVITLSTITSVAEPAESELIDRLKLVDSLMLYCGYSLSATDYALFVPLIEGLSRRAQGKEHIEALPSQAIILKPFTVRQAVGTRPNNSSCLTLYWRHSDTAFCEENTLKHQYSTNGKQQRISLSIPAQQAEYSRFRLDIAENPGCYQLTELALCDSTGTIIWQWDFDIDQLSNIGEITFYKAQSSEKGICLMSNGYDPQFELNLPQSSLAALSGGGRLNISICAYT